MTLLEKDPQNSNSEDSSENRETFSWSKFSPATSVRWGWVFLERTRILSGIQFTTNFIEFFVVETKRFVGSFVNVILTRQTSSRDAERKRRALRDYFPERICYMFLISKCRGDRDLGLCTTLGAPYCTILYHTTIHCTTLQHTATHCNTLSPMCHVIHTYSDHKKTNQFIFICCYC